MGEPVVGRGRVAGRRRTPSLRGGPEPPSLRRHPGLVIGCVALVLAETLALWGAGQRDVLAIAPQVSAPEPFGIFHDLRWLSVFHSSWLAFSLEVIAFVVFRSAIVVALVGAAWPHDQPRPALGIRVRMAAGFVVVIAVLSALWVCLLFGVAVVSLGWLFFVGLPALLLVAFLTHHGVVRRDWWRDAPRFRTLGWMVLVFVELTVAGALLQSTPAVGRVPIALASGCFNAWAWLMVVHSMLAAAPRRRTVPVVPIGVALLVGLVIAGVAVGARAFAPHRAVVAASGSPRAVRAGQGPAVLVASGFDSEWDGRSGAPLEPSLPQARFSYRGIDTAGRPLPYTAADTHRSLESLVATMAAQVEALHRATGRPLALVGESEGSLVADAYVVAHPGSPVRELVLLSPLVDPGRVYYPARGDDGWGVATGWGLRAITSAVAAISPIDIPADAPLLRSFADHAPALRELISCRVPEVHELVIVPGASAVSAPRPTRIDAPEVVLPAFHGGLLSNHAARRAIERALAGRDIDPGEWAPMASTLEAAAAPWQVPPLPVGLNSAWAEHDEGSPSCARTFAAIRAWLG